MASSPSPSRRHPLDAAHAWVFSSAPVGMAIIDTDRVVVEVNAALAELMGRPADDLVGADVLDIVLPEHRAGTERWLELCFSGQPRAVHLETWFQRPSGVDAWVSVDGRAVPGPDGTTISAVLAVTDLTDARALHDELESTQRDLATLEEEAPIALKASEHRWRTLIQNIADTVTVVDSEGDILATTGELKTILGYPRDAWVGSNLADLLHPDDLATLQPVIDRVLAEPNTEITAEARVRHHDGSWVDLSVNAVNLLHDEHVGGVVLTTRNVTDRRRAEQLITSQSEILELIATGALLDDVLDAVAAMIEDHDHGVAAAVLLVEGDRLRPRARPGRGPSAALRSALAEVEITPAMQAQMARTHGEPVVIADVADVARTALTGRIEAAGHRSVWWAPVQSRGEPDPVGAIIAFHPERHVPSDHARRAADVACTLIAIALERHSTINELAHRALHDDLTGLPNRTLLLDRLQIGLDRARRMGEEIAVLYVDIDRFKMVNDSLGHDAGDVILTAVADRLRAVTRPGDTIARVGADEFVIVCDRPGSLSTLLSVADRLTETLRVPFRVDEREVFLTASLGLALSVPGSDGPSLLRNADAAMFRAKQRGRNRLEMYDSAMQASAHDRLAMGADLRRAVERGEMRVVYQPIVSLARGEIIGAEALLRWQHPVRGDVPPAVFIPVAEETGLITEIGAWVLDTALAEMAPLLTRRDDAFSLSVNLSTRQLDDPALVTRVAGALRAHDWPADQLCLELTETALTQDLDTALRVLVRLRAIGCRVAVDDFGTGYSSLTHLQRLPVDTIKIDRSFVRGLGEAGGSDHSTIATAVLAIAQAMDLTAIAEGVETPAQLNALRELGCPLGQGYLFSVPLPVDAFMALAGATSGPRHLRVAPDASA